MFATLLKPLLVGLLDTLEYKYFNPRVFWIHNFPDLVPEMTPGAFAAFVSGLKCSWFFYLPLSLLHHALKVDSRLIHLVSLIEVVMGIGIMLENRNNTDVFQNHIDFYKLFAGAELGTLLAHFFLIQ
jgi:hypothetical protein